MKNIRVIVAIILVVLGSRSGSVSAQNLTTLYSFTGSPIAGPDHDGAVPAARLARGSDGDFYGTTEFGGTNICPDGPCSSFGSVFSVNTGNAEAVIFRFNGGNGAAPVAGLLRGFDGNFYGTTQYGGTFSSGTVFQITSAGTFTTLYSFSGSGADGANPQAGLIGLQANEQSNFFGTTYMGGASNEGTIFMISINPPSPPTPLYSFDGGADGVNPNGDLVQGDDGYLYGTTRNGGTNGCGTVFKFGTNGVFTTLWQFCSLDGHVDGAGPNDGLVKGSDGNLYGTTRNGGTNGCGVAFQITKNGVLTPLYQFCNLIGCSDGGFPLGGLVQGVDGNLYGTTSAGGASLNCPGGCGTAFSLTIPLPAPVNQVSGFTVVRVPNSPTYAVTVTIPSIHDVGYQLQVLESLDTGTGSWSAI